MYLRDLAFCLQIHLSVCLPKILCIYHMEANSNNGKFTVDNCSGYDHEGELKNFLETKAGVKGLVDSGIVKVPRIFIQPPEKLPNLSSKSGDDDFGLQVPVIDLKGIENQCRRQEIVQEIREAAGSWGLFQMINHGVPIAVIDDVLETVRQFHEQPLEVKLEFYLNDEKQPVSFHSNAHLNPIAAANWRDSLLCRYPDQQLDEEAIPQVCRKAISKYMKYIFVLKETLSALLSEALGIRTDYLSDIECMESTSFLGNYYPACPEPDLALGVSNHSDPFFLTILAQDNIIGGLQILHQNQWVDVHYVHGSLVANVGDLMQLVSNDKFKSVVHRVLAKAVGPRTSVACFFFPSTAKFETSYGPVKEILSEENPPLYQEVSFSKYFVHFQTKCLDGISAHSHFKLSG